MNWTKGEATGPSSFPYHPSQYRATL